MDYYEFGSLDVSEGDIIELQFNTGRVANGQFEGNYDGSSFSFYNFASMRIETIYLEIVRSVLKR